MFDTTEFTTVIEKLERLVDEQLAATLLSRFSQAQSNVSKLLLNNDESLSNEQWKVECDKANEKLKAVLVEIDTAVAEIRG